MAFVVAIGYGVQAPALPVFAEHFGVGNTAVGSLVSAFALMRLVSGPVGGHIVNRTGEMRTLIAGMAILAVASALAALSASFAQLVLLRGAGGIGSALYSVAAISLLFRITPSHLAGRAVGIFEGAFYSGTIIGPAIGGPLAAISPRIPFVVYGAAVGVAATVAVVSLRRLASIRGVATDVGDVLLLRHLLKDPEYRVAISSNVITGWAAFGVRVTVVPLFLLNVVGAPALWIGVGMSACAVIQAGTLPYAGRRADVWSPRRPVILGEAIMALSFVCLATFPSLPAYLLTQGLLGLGVAFVTAGGATIVARRSGPGGGMIVAAYQAAADAGMVVGPLVTGIVTDHLGYGFGLGMTAVVIAVALVTSLSPIPPPRS